MTKSADIRPVTVSLPSKTEARLRAHAAASGIPLEDYLVRVLDREARMPVGKTAAPQRFDPDRNGSASSFDPAVWDRVLAGLAEGAEGIPALPAEDLDRASIYRDHD